MQKEYKVVSSRYGAVDIAIRPDGKIDIVGMNSDVDVTNCNIPKSIWEMYKNYRTNDCVVRSGSALCGAYEYRLIDENYTETDTLHSTTVEEVARNIFRFYPSLFSVTNRERIISLLRYHDLGEIIDNPDDGSKDKEEKFSEELQVFNLKTSCLPPAFQIPLLHDFIIFENADADCWDREDKRIMQFAKLCDKVDAPLSAFIFELQGRPGSLLHKEKFHGGITDQDQKYIDETGDYSQAGVWTAHLIDVYHNYKYFDLFIEVVIEACKDVRKGQIFPWMYEFCKKRGINDIILQKTL